MRPPRWGQLTDVPGVRVGHARRTGHGRLSGVTVILPPPGTIGAVDVRGGGPGTHETDALDPSTLVPVVDAVTLTGGSAYGLAAARGVQDWLERQGRGFAAGPPEDPRSLLVPIVPAAAVFDLGRGGEPNAPGARPDAEIGLEAAQDAGDSAGRPVPRGNEGAGTGALMAAATLKGGVGTASVTLPGGVVVGALVVVNAMGSPIDPVTGALLGTAFVPAGLDRPPAPDPAGHRAPAAPGTGRVSESGPASGTGTPGTGPTSGAGPGLNTTLAVVVTNAGLTPAQARRTATAAHDGIARALSPAHTLLDGDTVFALATGEAGPAGEAGDREALGRLLAVQSAAADAVLLAILDAVLSSGGITRRHPKGVSVPGYLDLYPSGDV